MKKQISIIATLGIFAGILYWFTLYHSADYKKITSVSSWNPQLQYVTDFEDINRVVWAAENVFVWKVVKNIWKYEPKENESNFPQTLFEVQVIYNIKWILKNKIIVQQMWGYDKHGRLFVPEDADLLQEWEVYILSWGKWDWFYWIDAHPNAHIKLDISWRNIKNEISENKTVQDFREAYKNEIYFDESEGDIYRFWSKINAYEDLTEEQKWSLDIFHNWFVE